MPSSIKINCYQILLLIWKSLLLRRRHYIVTAFEIILPLLLSIIPVVRVFSMTSPQKRHPLSIEVSLPEGKNATFYDPYNPLNANDIDIKTVLYTPNSTFAKQLVEGAIKKINRERISDILPMDSEEDIEKYLIKMALYSKYYEMLGIVFTSFAAEETKLPSNLDYKLRFSNANFDTKNLYSPFYTGGPRRYDHYKPSGFWSVQLAIDQTYVEMIQENKNLKPRDIQVVMHRFPFPPYIDSSDYSSVLDIVPTIVIYGLVVLCPVIVKRTIDEKANGAKEMMKMMGMENWVYWSGTFTNHYLVLLIICIASTFLYTVHFKPGISVVYYTNFLIVFLVLALYSAALVLFCLAVTTFFNRAVIGVIVIILLSCLSQSLISTFYFTLGSSSNLAFLTVGQKLGICLLPNGALIMAFKIMSVLEIYKVGANWDNISTFYYSNVSFAMVMAMLLVSCVIYSIIIWYVDAVWPWQYGIPKPVYFPFTRSYWCGSKKQVEFENAEHFDGSHSSSFEEDPIGQTPGIVISNLTKLKILLNKVKLHSSVTELGIRDSMQILYFCSHICATACLADDGYGDI